jgi:hypothetical protein
LKALKTAGLAVLATTAVMMFCGAGTASASVLCSTNTSPCTGTTYGAKTTFTAQLKSGTSLQWTTPFGNITCTSSTYKGELTNAEGHGVISSAVMSPLCTGPGGSGCSLIALNMPWTFQISASGSGNGTFTMTGSGGGFAGMHYSCGSLINCDFRWPTLTLTGGNPAHLTATAQPVEVVKSGGCLVEKATLDATYEITSPKPLFVI